MEITIDRSPDLDPVFMIGIDDMFLDYEFSYSELLKLQKAVNDAVKLEKESMN